ncbi:hypothetical protein BGZ76_004060 [Entomortierella beljakovae]|nr:hypothetical protein BGZ76_004060 [Entomortierella beljakovae]
MVHRDPETDTNTKNARNTRSQPENTQNTLPNTRLRRSNSSQEKQPQDRNSGPSSQATVSSSASDPNVDNADELTLSATQENELSSMNFYTQVEDELQVFDSETSGQPGPSSQPEPMKNEEQDSESKHKTGPIRSYGSKNRIPLNKTRRPPYSHSRQISKYPLSELPPADDSSYARIVQQHLLFLLPSLEEAISDWNRAESEEEQDYWAEVIRSLEGRVDHTCRIFSSLLPHKEPPKKELDASLDVFAKLIQENWHRPPEPPQEKVVFYPMPGSQRSWRERQRDEDVVVVDE